MDYLAYILHMHGLPSLYPTHAKAAGKRYLHPRRSKQGTLFSPTLVWAKQNVKRLKWCQLYSLWRHRQCLSFCLYFVLTHTRLIKTKCQKIEMVSVVLPLMSQTALVILSLLHSHPHRTEEDEMSRNRNGVNCTPTLTSQAMFVILFLHCSHPYRFEQNKNVKGLKWCQLYSSSCHMQCLSFYLYFVLTHTVLREDEMSRDWNGVNITPPLTSQAVFIILSLPCSYPHRTEEDKMSRDRNGVSCTPPLTSHLPRTVIGRRIVKCIFIFCQQVIVVWRWDWPSIWSVKNSSSYFSALFHFTVTR